MAARKSRMAQVDAFRYTRGCLGKKSHPSKKKAMGVLRTLANPDLNAYRCAFCHRWHIGKDKYRVVNGEE